MKLGTLSTETFANFANFGQICKSSCTQKICFDPSAKVLLAKCKISPKLLLISMFFFLNTFYRKKTNDENIIRES